MSTHEAARRAGTSETAPLLELALGLGLALLAQGALLCVDLVQPVPVLFFHRFIQKNHLFVFAFYCAANRSDVLVRGWSWQLTRSANAGGFCEHLLCLLVLVLCLVNNCNVSAILWKESATLGLLTQPAVSMDAGLDCERLREPVECLRVDEVHVAELAVLNTNQGYAQLFERISLWEEELRREVVEALWQDGKQEAETGNTDAAVQRFEQAVGAAIKLCADSKELRDRIVAMRRQVTKTMDVGGDKWDDHPFIGLTETKFRTGLAKFQLAINLEEQGADKEALELHRKSLDIRALHLWWTSGMFWKPWGSMKRCLFSFRRV